ALWKEVPVMATRVGGLRLQVQDHQTGRVIKDPLNEKEIGEKLLTLMTHRQESMAMGRRGWLETADNFLVPSHLRRYLKVFARNL
ncbi:MAG: glycosyl transferase family 1, partial [bacterium]|nr:glycosyl transferase family 1 [bacterium]